MMMSPLDEQIYASELQNRARSLDHNEIQRIAARLAHSELVMLGEATHGTSEFYLWRSEISKALIRDHGFNFVAVEGDWPSCQYVNQFLRGEIPTVEQAISAFHRWPTWMWANHETAGFLEWLAQRQGVGFYGLDVYSLFDSISEVITKAQSIDPILARRLRVKYACFESYNQDEIQYAKSLLYFPEGCQQEVVSALKELLNLKIGKIDPELILDLQQNGRIVRNAESYYRAMIEADSQAWNIRDQHMMDTLESLNKKFGKGIVWAHNTHIGDYHATDMRAAGYVNLGGLTRERYGEEKVALVGFGTNEGKVMASYAWEGEGRITDVPKARKGSLENLCHDVCEHIKKPAFWVDLSDSAIDSALAQTIGHRAIGVVYEPKNESRGQYVPTSLANRYDAFVFIDQTSAVHSLQARHVYGEFPETWPVGQ